MSKKISGLEYPLSKIFSSDFYYEIPRYQRPYAWAIDQASELFDDLIDFYRNEDEDGYFLGSIVLIKEDRKPHAEVIDGQQRLTTLTILLAALAAQMDGAQRKDSIVRYICEPGNEFEGLKPRPRLTLRERDQGFFAQHVQAINIDSLEALDERSLENEAQRNLRSNAMLMQKRLRQQFAGNQDELIKFGQFILQRCFIVAVCTPSQQSAFRVFSVMNSRGLDLQPTDIIKADVIGKIEDEKQGEFSARWEDMEVELGRSGFNDLFSFVRMIYAKDKAKRALLEEFREHVLPKISSPHTRIVEVLELFADSLYVVRNARYVASSNAQNVNNILRWLNRIDNSDWIPPAILFLNSHGNAHEYVLWFFTRLERLAACLHVCAKNVNERIERYAALISVLEKPSSMQNPVSEVELRSDEIAEMLQVLDSEIYHITARRRNYIILRLDSFISDGAATYDHTILTIEHVLPQTVEPESEWANVWPDATERGYWTHRLANLIPLNFRRNAKASNYDFEKKKSAYFGGSKQVSSFVLTTQVLQAKSWSPEHVKSRQAQLLDVLKDKWSL